MVFACSRQNWISRRLGRPRSTVHRNFTGRSGRIDMNKVYSRSGADLKEPTAVLGLP